jgi:hypothetical protein
MGYGQVAVLHGQTFLDHAHIAIRRAFFDA